MINYNIYRNGPKGQNGALEAKGVQRAHGADGLNGLRGACGRHGANGLRGANGHHGLNRVYRALSFIIYPLLFIILLTCPFSVQAQIKIGGNVYGGGNHADVKGSTKVTVKAGDIGAVLDPDAERPLEDPHGRVFGGARMANVGGNTFVHIDGENATDYILINQVYGGNDIAGAIGTAKAVKEEVPTELTAIKRKGHDEDATDPKRNSVDDTFNSYVRVSTKVSSPNVYYTAKEIAEATSGDAAYGKTTNDVKTAAVPASDAKKIYIGQLFAGGNGDFDYEQSAPVGGKVTHTIYNRWDKKHITPLAQVVTDAGEVGFQLPELDKTYLEVVGGSIVYAYGGGNDATVKEQNIIHIDNPSAVVNHILVSTAEATKGVEAEDATYTTYEHNLASGSEAPIPPGYTDLLSYARFREMGINTTFSQPSSGEYQVGRFFGGNNKAEMKIRPAWNLLAGKVRNLYSGGNRGNMTSPEGLLLEIPTYSSLIVDNLYGGCRMADVIPTVDGIYKPCVNLPGYYFPNELSARTLVRGGHINNVYGGNDVTGKVYGGNAIGIYTTVYGDVYGGGNGNYPYTDNDDLKNNDVFGDFYYEKPSGSDMSSDEALNAFRPNAEQVSIRLAGKNATPAGYTVIQGSVFLGGNCASLATAKDNTNPLAELKIGSYVIADNVFLGNNGAGMINQNNLKYYAGYVDDNGNYNASDGNKFSSLDLTDASVFKTYMTGVAMPLKPNIVFDSETESDPATYIPFSSFVGSFYCGGNVGSMTIKGKETFTIKQGLNIFEKFVGGCNNADVKAIDGLCADYEGGVIGTEDEQEENGYMEGGKIKDRIEINLENLTITPLRWNDSFTQLLWNTQKWSNEVYTEMEVGTKLEAGDKYYTYSGGVYSEQTAAAAYTVGEGDHFYEKGGFVKVARDPSDSDIRLLGGNVYGGCYESGHVNGNVVININQEMLNKDKVFGNSPDGVFGNPASGVELEDQRDDLMAVALSVFGAGYGEKTEVWGSTTVNHTNGYTFQIYGGGEQGVVGKKNDEGDYDFDPAYSATVNLSGGEGATANANDDVVANLAEAEYIYGGGNEGDVCGNTYVNLGNGRIYDAFGGASDADILGHTEVYIGRQPNGSGGYKDGFPWIRDIVYGGNDFGGTIFGEYEDEDKYNYGARLRNIADMPQLHGYKDGEVPDVLKSSTYVEYLIGRVDTIFGGGYGSYNYTNTALYGVGSAMPVQHSSFVNIRPKDHAKNALKAVFGGGTGYPGNRDADQAQDRSYVLIDISGDMAAFGDLEAFGGGSYNGLGMKYTFDSESGKTVDESGTAINLDEASAIVDLLHGKIKNAFGGSYQEGVTRRTVVNVPAESTIKIENIFGGAYGKYILPPCDVYEAQVNYKNTSENAQMSGAIYGGNNNERRSLFTQVNISSPVWTNKDKGYTGTVYGAGRGIDTWSEYTEVNLLDGAKVYEAYGGGEMGHVLNSQSIQVYMQSYKEKPSLQISAQDSKWSKADRWTGTVGSSTIKTEYAEEWAKDWKDTWTLGSYYVPNAAFDNYATNAATNLSRVSERPELDANTAAQLDGEKKHNTNVIVNPGAVVDGYIYGGGLGDKSELRTGDVYGKTYVAVLGGEVKKDVYAGGRAGGLDNIFEASGVVDFQATANAYVQGGTARNVYGGGYEGHVGHHDGDITTAYTGDRPAQAYVVIGKAGTNTFEGGAPAITRNVYGGGEGGSVYGSSHVTINNGYVGYRYTDNKYVEELKDKTPGDLDLSGNVFGGGYVVNSYVDNSIIKMYGGQVRGSLYGGGEIGPIGRGGFKNATGTGIENGDAKIFKAGLTEVNMYDGKVLRNVFGGGRGKDSWGGDGTMYMDQDLVKSLKADGLFCKGYVFGQTRVNIHGGEVGTDEGVDLGYGNVFGACDLGSVYSAYEDNGTLCIGKKNGVRYDKLDNHEGYYYKYENNAFKTSGSEYILTEDCKVVVEPWCLAKSPVEINGTTYPAGTYVPTSALNYLGNKSADAYLWNVLGKSDVNKEGVIIHNAVFAGGNVTSGSTDVYANTPTVFGNATASIHDVYNRDLISIGRGRVGGLYGDGNLTLVDGYRELNITNYGTDYYHITPEISLATYKALPNREAAYYEIRYKCVYPCTDKDGKTYVRGSTITADEMQTVFDTKTVVELTPIVDSAGNPVLDDDGYPTFNTTTNNVSMLDASGKPRSYYWQENGVCSRYAGRPMNTIQRADFCGVFGSRMVMQGAQDRVPETVDYTNYTINRVREVSLNKKVSVRSGDASDPRNAEHGNYFGIYSVVNFLGALTSDFDFYGDNGYIRTTDNSDAATYKCDAEDADKNPIAYGEASFADWKRKYPHDRRRNNGNSHNRVALASGVYLELTTEKSTGTDLYQKDWGYITGVVELDLINVQTGIGGGYVYAKNEHGVRSTTGKNQTILTALNAGAITNKKFQYTTAEDSKLQWETSGNFVHSTQTIIDDCYNIGGKYLSNYNKPDGVPAHYWFIKGSVYIYDQYISAYTGSPNAYSEVVNIPLTITSASHGKMTLLNVMPNRYAYYSVNSGSTKTTLDEDKKIALGEKEYGWNDAINYWDYSQLTSSEKGLFVNETYIVTADCTYGTGENPVTYKAGTVLLPGNPDGSEPGTYYYLKNHAPTKKLNVDDTDETPYVHHVGKNQDVDFDYVFRPSNNVSHGEGYILTYSIDNPNQWNTWYTPKSGTSQTGKVDSKEIKDKTRTDYEDGPTYTPLVSGLYGQNDYSVGSIISKDIYDTYQAIATNADISAVIPTTTNPEDPLYQASFYPAFIVTDEVLEATNNSGTEQRFYKGATLAAQDYAASTWSTLYNPKNVAGSSVAPAYVATSTIQLSPTEYIYRGSYMTAAEKKAYKDAASNPDLAALIETLVVPAYYCTDAGKYGGNYYETGHNYRGLAAFSSMSETDRAHFTFNYDALDLLIDPDYSRAEGVKYQYDGENYTTPEQVKTGNKATYSLATPIDYSATYQGASSLTYIADADADDDGNLKQGREMSTANSGTVLSRTEYERLPNEQYYYAPITVDAVGEGVKYYVVKKTLVLGDTPYAAGQVISKDTYDGLSGDLNSTDPKDHGDKAYVDVLTFSSTGTYYYCREGYTIPNNADGHAITSATGVTGAKGGDYAKNKLVPTGVVINEGMYETLTNQQKNFAIHGLAPTETSTLYVPRNSDILDLSAEKIITVVYQYDYVESDADGKHITPVSERHILNIHLNFKSGIPIVEDIQAPKIVLPGTSVTMPEPYVTPGAYEITGSGWELFDDEGDAESHVNGVEYVPSFTPLYLYQNKYYLAYYTKTYLGKTYSNYVPVTVANYHDLKKVFEAKEDHYFIDHKDLFKTGNIIEPKIYINDYSKDAEGSKNGLDLFKSLYDLSVLTGYTVDSETGLISSASFTGHKPLDEKVKNGNNLEFFMRTDIERGTETVANPEYNAEDPEETDPPTITRVKSWTPIASSSGECFQGTLHGDGHTISGLDHSLFGHLCGDVYNLGVTGSFTSAGVADEGGGYVENCWINTTGTPDNSVYAVFGNPNAGDKPKQIVNCYYQEREGTNYKSTSAEHAEHGVATPKPQQAFYNGEVAYDLNGFYLYKRYSDKQAAPTNEDAKTKEQYQHYIIDADNKVVLQPVAYYSVNADNQYTSTGYLPSGYDANKYVVPMYVEDRFADGDFRYAAGTIPTEADIRTYTDPEDATNEYFFPIWPDDYFFFGQKLTYGYGAYTHQDVPSAVVREDGLLSQNEDANRVYRAPAYFRSKDMGVAHFNPTVYLAQKEKLTDEQIEANETARKAYPGMTAIDFAGHNDNTWGIGSVSSGFPAGSPAFYPPLLDDDGLTSIQNCDETQNLLVYAPAETSTDGYANAKTHGVLTSYFKDPEYTTYYDNTDGYRLVRDAPSGMVHGHLVQSDLKATDDHLLVDKQDFNCPIAYDFDGNHRMWYQRMPADEEFVDRNKGWQGVSIPFTAELVTTDDKGEITHFYSGSDKSQNGTTKGHEYWLREMTNESTLKQVGETKVLLADFHYPNAAGANKTVTNTFLWDYYYQNTDVHDQKDKNADIYLQYRQYYKGSRTYSNYPLLSAAKPYILGLPDKTYYEFDLSGKFEAENTAVSIPRLDKQTITFASDTHEHIGVSDDEMMTGTIATYNSSTDYYFKPSYMNQELDTKINYVLNSEGNAYVQLNDDPDTYFYDDGYEYTNAKFIEEIGKGTLFYDQTGTPATTWTEGATYYKRTGVKTTKNDKNHVSPSVSAFRPYFYVPGAASVKGMLPSSIVFSGTNGDEFGETPESALDGSLEIFSRGRNIVTRSHMKEPVAVRVVNAAGITLANFVLPAGETIETPVNMPGIYIVNRKKLSIR